MVIGNGLIAKRFSAYQNDTDCLIFASGVSDSKTILDSEFKREKDLLLQTILDNPGKKLVYFSTCSVADSSVYDSPYVNHKLEMEDLIKQQVPRYVIFRLANIVGKGGNSKTVFNYLFTQIAEGNQFTLWSKSVRNILDIDDVYKITDWILRHNEVSKTWNVAAPKSHTAQELVVAMEKFLNKKGNYQIVEKGSSYEIDITSIRTIISELEINFDQNYIQRLLEKCYSDKL